MPQKRELAEEEPDDYMCPSIIAAAAKHARPGVSRSETEARRHEIDRKTVIANERNAQPNRAQAESTAREEALDKPLASDSKGFIMLTKMGYTPGTSLGRQSHAIVQPIKPVVKVDRAGIGHDVDCRRKLDVRWKAEIERTRRQTKEQATLIVDYRCRKQLSVDQSRVMSDFHLAQRACRQMDMQSKTEGPPCAAWFWPTERRRVNIHDDPMARTEEEGDEEEVDPDVGLPILLNYLRCEYLYCIYCGCQYDNETDLMQNCAGETRVDHDE